jgi:hypothetical protein
MSNVIDQYTLKHLDAWLESNVDGDTRRDKVRAKMLELIADDQEYWGAQTWTRVYDNADCGYIE